MQTRHTHVPAQTIKQAKADYKKNGPRLSSQQERQLKRSAELFERAQKIKEQEQRKKIAKEKRVRKEEKDRELRRRSGLPSQPLPKIAASQQLLSGFFAGDKPNGDQRRGQSECDSGNSDAEDAQWNDVEDDVLLDTVNNVEMIHETTTVGPPVRSGNDHKSASTPSMSMADADSIKPLREAVLSSEPEHKFESCAASTGFAEGRLVGYELFDCMLSTQDVSFSGEDLAELGVADSTATRASSSPESKPSSDDIARRLMPPPPLKPAKPRQARGCKSQVLSNSTPNRVTSNTVTLAPPKSRPPASPRYSSMSKRCAETPVATVDFFDADFELSSQDQREICR